MTTEAPAAAAIPPVVEWTLRNVRRNDERTFTQSELTIDGEARLVQILSRVAGGLAASGYSLRDLWDLTDDTREMDWVEVGKLVTAISAMAPDAIGEIATVFFGIFPTDEDGQPDESYEPTVKWLRGALNISRFVDMARVFMGQNDYARMIAPFSQTLAGTMDAIAGGSQGGKRPESPDPSSGPRVLGSDGSMLELETPSETTNSTTEVPENGSGTSSEPSSD